MKSLLEAGVHFGHQTHRWNPKMSRYIYGSRNNIHIIDLQKTVRELKKALVFIRNSVPSPVNKFFLWGPKDRRKKPSFKKPNVAVLLMLPKDGSAEP